YDTLRLQGLIEYVLGNHEEARLLVQKSLQIAQDAEDGRRIAQAHHLLMMIAARLRDGAETHRHGKEAMDYYEQIQDQPMLEGLRAEYAGSLLAAGEYDAVIQESSKALAYFELIQHQRWVSALCNNLAEAYHETGQYENAKAFAERALEQRIPRAAPYALFHLGRYQLVREEAEKAVALFNDGIERARANDDRFILAYLEREAGVAWRRAGSASTGRPHLLNAATLFRAMNDAQELEVTMALLGPENDLQ
ncbi:MAG: hypothetical protein KDE34_06225, partial [Anaerolineales bacterium]|nr:hypothetical protein [Anaerolineales bacterium]